MPKVGTCRSGGAGEGGDCGLAVARRGAIRMTAAERRSGVRSKGVLPVETTVMGRSKIRAGRGAGDAEADALALVDVARRGTLAGGALLSPAPDRPGCGPGHSTPRIFSPQVPLEATRSGTS